MAAKKMVSLATWMFVLENLPPSSPRFFMALHFERLVDRER